jgi:hypothetical protein
MIWEISDIPYWYAQNTFLFVRRSVVDEDERLKELYGLRGSTPLPLMHPIYYLTLCSWLRQPR